MPVHVANLACGTGQREYTTSALVVSVTGQCKYNMSALVVSHDTGQSEYTLSGHLTVLCNTVSLP